MAEPFIVAKAVDISGAALGKSTSIVIKGLLVLAQENANRVALSSLMNLGRQFMD